MFTHSQLCVMCISYQNMNTKPVCCYNIQDMSSMIYCPPKSIPKMRSYARYKIKIIFHWVQYCSTFVFSCKYDIRHYNIFLKEVLLKRNLHKICIILFNKSKLCSRYLSLNYDILINNVSNNFYSLLYL